MPDASTAAPLLACPIMADLVARHRPPMFEPEPAFPSLVDAIVSQQISGKAAASILSRLAELIPIRPNALATADLRVLRRAGLSRAKATYVRELARFARAGGLRGLRVLPDAAVVERLVSVKGIGVWTAEMFLIFSLNRPDVWPVGDGGIQRAAARLYRVKSLRRLQALGERFRPVRSHAAWYLWRSLSDG
jgi:DNA-3-methyladenine glycosylase II